MASERSECGSLTRQRPGVDRARLSAHNDGRISGAQASQPRPIRRSVATEGLADWLAAHAL